MLEHIGADGEELERDLLAGLSAPAVHGLIENPVDVAAYELLGLVVLAVLPLDLPTPRLDVLQ